MRRLFVLVTLILGLVTDLATSEEKVASEKAKLRLNASPSVARTLTRISFTGFLAGDNDLERYYCPEVEWRFGDGARSVRSTDCRPLDDDATIDRFWSTRHRYHWSGDFDVTLILRQDGRAVASATTKVIVR